MPSTNFNISELVYSEELAIGTDSIYSNGRTAVFIIGPIRSPSPSPIIREGCFVWLCMHLVVRPIQRNIFLKYTTVQVVSGLQGMPVLLSGIACRLRVASNFGDSGEIHACAKMGSLEETLHPRRRASREPIFARACISPESPKSEITRSLASL